MDGIAVITNKANTIESLTLDQVRQIFTGEVTEWEEVQ
ncbi:substrate-binding domain-containing protein [Jeotgalibaca porci]